MKVLRTMLRAFLLGIGVGVLIAPRAGSQTREMLSQQFDKVLAGADTLTNKLEGNNPSTTSYTPSQHYPNTEPNVSTSSETATSDQLSM